MLRTTSSSSVSGGFLSSPRSNSGAAASGEQSRFSWFPSILAVNAVEDCSATQDDLERSVDEEPEEAEEVTEKSDLDAAAEDRALPIAFNAARHLYDTESDPAGDVTSSWRMRERMRTVSVALVVCLNVGVDPPDVTKTQPCARMECWIDPSTLNPQRAIEAIGNSLQKQYERWQPRARYRQSLDPPLEEVRRLATGLRRNARDERVLFHYNGHGVPKPTVNGEIWVFNRNYTQYIPLSLYDLQAWMGSPSIFVYDCSNAGIIVKAFEDFALQHEREYLEQVNSQGVAAADLPPPISQKNCIQLAACAANQILPMNPELPADLFTACLTTPIKMALRWFVMQKHGKLAPDITVEMLDKIPGQFGDRRTMLGELNWIFTAITDTIAWNTLPRDLFQKLFRQDLLVASLFRNFLLAERILRSYDCTPISQPALPSTHQHSMWKAWDMAVDMSLAQLNDILEKGKPYQSSAFFEEQLTAFEVWLKFGDEHRPPPEQLPIVLQVLLSQAHRLRALDLLGRFLDLGPWAVHLALSVGIFPYVLKLLQSSARELRPLLVSIWAKILAVDPSCQTDLIRDSSHKYFLSVLQDECMMPTHRTWAAFILATIVNKYRTGQEEAEQGNLISICLEHLDEPEPVLRQWLAIALGRVWDKHEKARWRGARDNAHEKLYELLKDPAPEVRAAAVFALGTFLNSCEERTEHANNLDHSIAHHLLNTVSEDASPIVRKELVVALGHVVNAFEANFVTVCRVALEESAQQLNVSTGGATAAGASNSGLRRVSSREGMVKLTPSISSPALDRIGGQINRSTSSLFAVTSGLSSLSLGSIFTRVWASINFLTYWDPHPDVSSMAQSILIYLKVKAREKEKISRISSILETTSSVPSSPAKPSFMLGTSPPMGTAAGHINRISPIAEDGSPRKGSVKSTGGPTSLPPAIASKKSGSQSLNPSPSNTQTARDLKPPELTTDFMQCSARYFTKQHSHDCIECDCDHESKRHWAKDWLYRRNLDVRSEAEKKRELLKTRFCRLDEQLNSFKVPYTPKVVRFHPYNNQLAVVGAKQIHIKDLATSNTICSIEMNDVKHKISQFTTVSYINAHDQALLLAGSDDGFLRVYRDQDNQDQTNIRLVTAWNAMTEIAAVYSSGNRPQVGLSAAWEQKQRLVAVGGDCKVIRLWDANKETKRCEYPSGASDISFVSCLSFFSKSPHLLCAGYGDGCTRIFDIRTSEGIIQTYRDHTSSILDCAIQDVGGYMGHLVSGSTDGEVRVTDTRLAKSSGRLVKSISLGQKLNSLAIHKRAPLVAAWTTSQLVTVHTLLGSGGQLNAIKHTEGLLGYRRGPVGCLNFHPYLLRLATGPLDGIVSVYDLRQQPL